MLYRCIRHWIIAEDRHKTTTRAVYGVSLMQLTLLTSQVTSSSSGECNQVENDDTVDQRYAKLKSDSSAMLSCWAHSLRVFFSSSMTRSEQRKHEIWCSSAEEGEIGALFMHNKIIIFWLIYEQLTRLRTEAIRKLKNLSQLHWTVGWMVNVVGFSLSQFPIASAAKYDAADSEVHIKKYKRVFAISTQQLFNFVAVRLLIFFLLTVVRLTVPTDNESEMENKTEAAMREKWRAEIEIWIKSAE